VEPDVEKARHGGSYPSPGRRADVARLLERCCAGIHMFLVPVRRRIPVPRAPAPTPDRGKSRPRPGISAAGRLHVPAKLYPGRAVLSRPRPAGTHPGHSRPRRPPRPGEHRRRLARADIPAPGVVAYPGHARVKLRTIRAAAAPSSPSQHNHRYPVALPYPGRAVLSRPRRAVPAAP
jgi:hypothetical protein